MSFCCAARAGVSVEWQLLFPLGRKKKLQGLRPWMMERRLRVMRTGAMDL